MRRFADEDEIDLVIVGCGAGGSVLAQRLARAGWRVAALDAGPFWDPDADWVSDEAGSHHLYWTEPRVITGTDPVPMGSNNSGRGVGGSMVHYAGYTPRFHPSDFATRTQDGVGADWPISYRRAAALLRADRAGTAGRRASTGPGATRTATRTGRTRSAATGRSSCAAPGRWASQAKVGPVAITNGRFGNRPHCIYRGFCLQGCKVNAKASPLITHIPDALAHGAEVRADAMVTRIAIDGQTGRALGVHYIRDGRERFQRARPWSRWPDTRSRRPGCCSTPPATGSRTALATTSTRSAATSWCRARRRPRAGSTPRYGCTRRRRPRSAPSSSTRPTRPPATSAASPSRPSRPLPITWAEHVAAQGHWGGALREYMSDYVHWACLGALCEFLPQPENRVTLAEEKDRHGLPVASSPTPSATTTAALAKAAQARHGGHPARRRGR